jgi:glutaredoxin-related protein
MKNNIKTFEEYITPLDISILDNLLNKRLSYLKKFSDKEKKNGYEGINNIRIENNSVIFDDDTEDCRYDNTYFYVVGDEGETRVNLSGDFLKEIKKQARAVNCGGLK